MWILDINRCSDTYSCTFHTINPLSTMYSAEESSPVYHYETCCVCDEDFSSDSELANHLLDHADDEEFQISLRELEQKTTKPPIPSTPRNVPEYKKTSFVRETNQTLKRNFTQRSKSPEVVDIFSDDEEEANSKKVPKLSNTFRIVTTPAQAAAAPPNVGRPNTAAVPTNVGRPNTATPTNVGRPNTAVPTNVGRPNTATPTNVGRPNTAVPTNVGRPNTATPTNVGPPNTAAPPSVGPPTHGAPYNCQACKLVFNDLKLYKEHLLTHDKAKPYVCQICNKKFAYKGTLRQHLHLHIGDKSHECKVCHKKFSMKRMLRQHEETHHALVPVTGNK